MTISRLTIDKLGVKLYDKVSAVIAELIANSYDADAEEVVIEAPMGLYLATRTGGEVSDLGHEIIVRDDGIGMTPDVINEFYLRVGGERRKDSRRGSKSPKFGRSVMGRKGIGKLAPFGICNTIEVISAGGDPVDGKDIEGRSTKGYLTAHFIMRKDEILSDSEKEYPPILGEFDGTVKSTRGTCIKMREFSRRKVPGIETFDRQLSHRFGVKSLDWQIKLVNTNSKTGPVNRESRVVGDFEIQTMPGTRIDFKGPTSEAIERTHLRKFEVVDHDSQKPVPSIQAGFEHADGGKFYPLQGWVGYASKSYRDELMAGIRIYCRGKIAAQTSIFGKKSGFTGEFNIRSYLVGELHADWLDEDEDLIRTDRRDILWSDPLGQAFEKWGQSIVKLIGQRSREPLRKKMWEQFLEVGNVVDRVNEAFPDASYSPIRDTTLDMAKLIGTRLREEEVRDSEYVNSLVQLCLSFGPHIQLVDSLRDAASEEETSMGVIVTILKTARMAELSS